MPFYREKRAQNNIRLVAACAIDGGHHQARHQGDGVLGDGVLGEGDFLTQSYQGDFGQKRCRERRCE
jgi:hypothetical protein